MLNRLEMWKPGRWLSLKKQSQILANKTQMYEPITERTQPKFQGSKTIFIKQWMRFFSGSNEAQIENISTPFYEYDPELLEKVFQLTVELFVELELGDTHKWHWFACDVLEFKSENPDSGIEPIVKDYHYGRRPKSNFF
jgi:hypothetical protein